MLVLSDLGDGAGGASLLASTASSAGILVHNSGDVLELKNATGAGVNANATGDALVGIDYGMSHDFSSLLTGATDDARRFDSGKNIPRARRFAIPCALHLHTVRRVNGGLLFVKSPLGVSYMTLEPGMSLRGKVFWWRNPAFSPLDSRPTSKEIKNLIWNDLDFVYSGP